MGNEEESSAILQGTKQALASRGERGILGVFFGQSVTILGVFLSLKVLKPLVGRQLGQVVESLLPLIAKKLAPKE